MSDYVKVPVDGWEIQEIDHPIDEGISIRSKGISYCVWKLEEPAVYLLLKAMIEASPEPESVPIPQSADQAEMMQKVGYAWLEANAPERLATESAEPVVCLEISSESYRFKVANQDALIALEDGEHWLYTDPPKQEWIKCSERLPDFGQPVLGFGHTFDPTTVYSTARGWYEYVDDEFIAGITHWMPLPQPPKD